VSWLLGIARRCVDDVFAARPPLVQSDVEFESVDHRALEPETVERLTLRAAVVGLDARSQELVALRYGADLTARQIAEILGERTNTVEVALHRALGKLRRALAQEEEPEAAEEAAPRQPRSAAAV
jgi:RNA polymerase sigma-70 factor (ECF subfamily)